MTATVSSLIAKARKRSKYWGGSDEGYLFGQLADALAEADKYREQYALEAHDLTVRFMAAEQRIKELEQKA
jgi:hypothetical protein